MKAYQIRKLAHPSQIETSSDVPAPVSNKGDVVVDVYATGLNFFDILQAQGKYQMKPPLPFVLGAEFAGVISQSSPIPKGCRYKAGDRVYGFAQGAYAEQVSINPMLLCPVPDHITFEQASVVGITYPTSYAGIINRGLAKEGEWVLVHAAAGGVGLAAVQIAKAIGCKVIATASTTEKRRICTERGGADHAVDYTKPDWQKEVMRITDGHGVDVVYDPVGMIVPSLKCVAWNARLVVVGFAGGTIEKVPANLALLKQVSIVGLAAGQTYLKDPPTAFKTQKSVFELLQSHKVTPVTFEPIYNGLDEIPHGLQDLEGRKTWGKAVVRVRDERGEVIGGKSGGVKAKL